MVRVSERQADDNLAVTSGASPTARPSACARMTNRYLQSLTGTPRYDLAEPVYHRHLRLARQHRSLL